MWLQQNSSLERNQICIKNGKLFSLSTIPEKGKSKKLRLDVKSGFFPDFVVEVDGGPEMTGIATLYFWHSWEVSCGLIQLTKKRLLHRPTFLFTV